ncbi:MAG: sulfatase-like hydrolase/transferase [Cytophagales bacterium]|nr:sulfatase-like hydrolase/transferase [Cytophagales bacterium]
MNTTSGLTTRLKVFFSGIGFVFLPWANSALAVDPQDLPNVVFVLADDIGYGDLGSYGGKLPTPNLDKLAGDGMRFTDAHAPAALCAPSRFSLLTGSYPYRAHKDGGAWNVNTPSIFSDLNRHTAAGRQITVAEVMKRAGYRTAFFGKSHLGGDIRDHEGRLIRNQKEIHHMDFSKGVHNSINEYGFDYSYALPSGIQHAPFAFFENGIFMPFDPARPADNRSTKMWKNGRYENGKNGISEIVEHKEATGIGDIDYNSSQVGIMMVNKAINFIDNHLASNRIEKKDRPFLLYFASQAIHVPHTPPVDFDGDAREINEPVAGKTGGRTGDFIYELDLQVGRLMQKLEEEGIAGNTIFIFTSDNGALWPGVCDFGVADHDNNGPLRGYKASVYEGGHRVPFIIKWPGKIQPGSVSEELVLAQDWVATMYELTGRNMEEDQAMDCTSLMPVLTGKPDPGKSLHPFILYQAGYSRDGAIREGDWVLTVDRENKAEELYNLADDLGQENNLIDDPGYEKLVRRLHAKFLKYNDHKNETREPRTTEAFRVDM